MRPDLHAAKLGLSNRLIHFAYLYFSLFVVQIDVAFVPHVAILRIELLRGELSPIAFHP